MLLTSVMNRPAEKKASLLACLPACVSREAWDCFFSVFPLVSKGESNLILYRDFHNLAGFCSRDPVIPFIIQKTLPHPFLSQNSCEISHCNLCKVNVNVFYHHKLHPAMLHAWTHFQAQSFFFLSFQKHASQSSIVYGKHSAPQWLYLLLVVSVLCRYKIWKKYRFMKNQKSCMSVFTHGGCQTRGARQQKLLAFKSL